MRTTFRRSLAVLAIGLAVALSGPSARADVLSEVRSALAALDGSDPIRVRVNGSVRMESGEGDEARVQQGAVELEAEATSEGLTLRYGSEVLERLRRERGPDGDGGASDGEETSTGLALSQVDVQQVIELIGQAGLLAERLTDAEMVAERPVLRDGKPTRLLELKLEPPFDPEDRKRLKEFDDTLRLWVDEQGLPVAAEEKVKLLFKVMLMSFTNEESRRWTMVPVGDRLVATELRSETLSGGLGEQAQTTIRVQLEVLEPGADEDTTSADTPPADSESEPPGHDEAAAESPPAEPAGE